MGGFPAFNAKEDSSFPSHHSEDNSGVLNCFLRHYPLFEEVCELTSSVGGPYSAVNHVSRAVVYPTFMAEYRISSPAHNFSGLRSDMLGSAVRH